MESPSQHNALPFGYEISGNREPPANAPDSAPTNPLLDENDSDFLASFFSDMNANRLNAPSIISGGLDMSSSFLDLPANFMGTATSFGLDPSSSSAMDFGQSFPVTQDPATAMLLGSTFVQAPFADMTAFSLAAQPEHQSFLAQEAPTIQSILRQQSGQQQQEEETIVSILRQQVRQRQLQQQQHQFSQQHQDLSSLQYLSQQESYLAQPTSPLSQRSHYHFGPNPLQSPSEDVLDAAASLMLTSPAAMSGGHHQSLPRSQGHLDPTIGHLQHQGLEEFQQVNRRDMAQARENNVLNEWQMTPRMPRLPRSDVPSDFQWGSDANFGAARGFNSEMNKSAAESKSMQDQQFKVLECLEPAQSTATTRPGSPSSSALLSEPKPEVRDLAEIAKKITQIREHARRYDRYNRSSKGSLAEGDSPPPLLTPGRKRAAVKLDRDSSTPGPSKKAGAVVKRRKPSTTASKPPRQNLTEEQKRRHHILSEQKRRTSIKDAFARLNETVPALRSARFSKSNMLRLTAKWMSELLTGNEELEKMLEDP